MLWSRAVELPPVAEWCTGFCAFMLGESNAKTHTAVTKVFEFLDLPYFKIRDFTKQNKREYPLMKDETRKLLIEFYKPHNEKLYSLINQHFDWDK